MNYILKFFLLLYQNCLNRSLNTYQKSVLKKAFLFKMFQSICLQDLFEFFSSLLCKATRKVLYDTFVFYLFLNKIFYAIITTITF